MQELANRLMTQGNRAGSILPAAIFGSAGNLTATLDLNRPRLRIGLWPIQSDLHPEIAMGLATVLGLLLERYRGIRVYRLFIQAEGDPDEFEWEIDQSQFDVDDWQLDELDENVAVWGELEKTDSSWTLTLNVENDLLEEGEDLKTLNYKSTSLYEMVGLLPQAAKDIAIFLEADDERLMSPLYKVEQWDDIELEILLEAAFEWEIDFFLQLWGQEWSEGEIQDDKDALVSAGQPLGDFGAWIAASTIGRTLRSADEDTAEILTSIANEIVGAFEKSSLPTILLSQVLHESGHASEAYDLIEANVENHESDVLARLTLAELYRRGGRIPEAVSAFQEAIEDDVVSADLFLRYADMIQVMDYNNFPADEYIMIDPDDYEINRMTWEAIEAYQAALELKPDDMNSLYRQLLQLLEIESGGERFWNGFKRIVESDKTGDKVRGLVDALYNVENMGPAFEILRAAASREPERCDIALNLAAAYLVNEQSNKAKVELQKARRLTDDPAVLADIDRLMLAAEDPNFESRVGEITDIVSAGNDLQTEDVEFLEAAVEKVPSFAEGYVFLAKAYIAWDEPSTAIEVLLDGHKNNPDDPDIAALLGQLLWEADEQELAFSYLNKGVEKNPNHVPLLAITGRYLFDNEQEDAAKAYLTRATMISPNDPMLAETRAYIARMLAGE